LGDKAEELRRAMEAYDLTVGCEFCKWQVDEGRPDLAFSKWFTEYPVTGPSPAWPQQLELSISNNCNLQCVMCNGEWSSSIRAHREHRPPLPKVYGDAFFEELRLFVPHLRRIKFLGGEPFLASETLRVMDLLVEMEADVRCHVTTNGTQWSPRVERILDMLPIDVAVSLDAATRETYEQVRIGADWDEVQTNLDRFQERAARRGTDVTVTFCLMAINWRDFAGFCEMADARGIGCAVNTVTEPAHLSLYRLPIDELEEVLAELERIEAERGATFGRSRATWLGELDRLRQHAEQKRSSTPVTGLDVRKHNPEFVRPFQLRENDLVPAPDGAYLEFDASHKVLGMVGGAHLLGIPAAEFIGLQMEEMAVVVGRHVGGIEGVEGEDNDQVFHVIFEGGRRATAIVRPFLPGPTPELGRVYVNWAEDGPAQTEPPAGSA
jgi:molybdenum cofactor biosynthesis enzyme MoaA